MLFDAMYTFVIVTMRLCGQSSTSPKEVSESKRRVADLSTPPLRTDRRTDGRTPIRSATQRQSRGLLKFTNRFLKHINFHFEIICYSRETHRIKVFGLNTNRYFRRSQTRYLGFSAQKAADQVSAAAAFKLGAEVTSKSQGKHHFSCLQVTR